MTASSPADAVVPQQNSVTVSVLIMRENVTYIYSTAIKIEPVQGATLADAQALDPKDGKTFQKFIVEALNELNKCGQGAKLIQEINNSGHECKIFAGNQHNDNCAKANPEGNASGMARMVKNFRPLQKNIPSTVKAMKSPQRPMGKGPLDANEAAPIIQKYREYKDDFKKIGEEFNMPTDRATAGAEFGKIMYRAFMGMGATRWLSALQTCNSNQQEVTSIIEGTTKLDDIKYYRFCLNFYDYLTPGTGCSTQVRIQPPGVFKTKNKDLIKECGTFKGNRAIAALLGHELIHAWRMMVGRRIVDDGWDEEMMTVGLGVCSGWPMTENRLRAGMKIPVRRKYCALPRYFSPELKDFMSQADQFDATLF